MGRLWALQPGRTGLTSLFCHWLAVWPQMCQQSSLSYVLNCRLLVKNTCYGILLGFEIIHTKSCTKKVKAWNKVWMSNHMWKIYIIIIILKCERQLIIYITWEKWQKETQGYLVVLVLSPTLIGCHVMGIYVGSCLASGHWWGAQEEACGQGTPVVWPRSSFSKPVSFGLPLPLSQELLTYYPWKAPGLRQPTGKAANTMAKGEQMDRDDSIFPRVQGVGKQGPARLP